MSEQKTNAELAEILAAAKQMDWQQVVLNGGDPCFDLHAGKFCGRAKRWEGHGEIHKFVSFEQLIKSATASANKRVSELEEYKATVQEEWNKLEPDCYTLANELEATRAENAKLEAMCKEKDEALELIAGAHPVARRLTYKEMEEVAAKALSSTGNSFIRRDEALNDPVIVELVEKLKQAQRKFRMWYALTEDELNTFPTPYDKALSAYQARKEMT